jgi:hypothetical protein
LSFANVAASLRALFPRSFDRLLMDGFSRGLLDDRCAKTTFATSAPY